MSSSDSDSECSTSTSSSSSCSSTGQVNEKNSNEDARTEKDTLNDNKAEEDDGKLNEENYDDPNTYQDIADKRKIFLSRVPHDFNKGVIIRIFENEFGKNCIEEVALTAKLEDEEEEQKHPNSKTNSEEEVAHRGFGFVTMTSVEKRNEAIEKGTVRGRAKEQSKRKHTIYIRPVTRQNEFCEQAIQDDRNICFLWSKFRCPYGDDCKFEHTGEGGCLEIKRRNESEKKKKKQKCFSFRSKGICKLGNKCPYSHDFEPKIKEAGLKRDSKDKVCINWKTKGKCRKGDKCPYRHDESVREAFLAKKAKKTMKRGRNENAQPLSVRVFGLNYDTKEEDVRELFKDCGKISEITFPTFEDSGRSKGYCGVLFTSPKATAKATELDGSSLHGRWLSIQGGKMYLRQWEDMEKERAQEANCAEAALGEFGQRVKRRKKHGFKED